MSLDLLSGATPADSTAGLPATYAVGTSLSGSRPAAAQPAVPVKHKSTTQSTTAAAAFHDPGDKMSEAIPSATAEVVETAPSLAGLSKIKPSNVATGNTSSEPSRKSSHRPPRIIVPQRIIQGGMDSKFETDPYGINLHGLLTPQQYTEAVNQINYTMRKSRANGVDTALLVTGPLLVPLALWGARHSRQVKKRKKLLRKAIEEFNGRYPTLYMRWNRRPESQLSIERRNVALHGAAPFGSMMGGGAGGGNVVGTAQQQQGVVDVSAMGEEDAFV